MNQTAINVMKWDGLAPQLNAEKFMQLIRFDLVTQNEVMGAAVQNIMNVVRDNDFGTPDQRLEKCECRLPRWGKAVKCTNLNCRVRQLYSECIADCGRGCQNNCIMNNIWKSKLRLVHRLGRGFGVVAKEPISPGNLILPYLGQIYTRSGNPLRHTSNYACEMFTSEATAALPEVTDRLVIEATLKAGWSRFVAHSCNPNCQMHTICSEETLHNVLIATRPIGMDEEITWNYGIDLTSMGIDMCLCGTRECVNRDEYLKWIVKNRIINRNRPTGQHSTVCNPPPMVPQGPRRVFQPAPRFSTYPQVGSQSSANRTEEEIISPCRSPGPEPPTAHGHASPIGAIFGPSPLPSPFLQSPCYPSFASEPRTPTTPHPSNAGSAFTHCTPPRGETPPVPPVIRARPISRMPAAPLMIPADIPAEDIPFFIEHGYRRPPRWPARSPPPMKTPEQRPRTSPCSSPQSSSNSAYSRPSTSPQLLDDYDPFFSVFTDDDIGESDKEQEQQQQKKAPKSAKRKRESMGLSGNVKQKRKQGNGKIINVSSSAESVATYEEVTSTTTRVLRSAAVKKTPEKPSQSARIKKKVVVAKPKGKAQSSAVTQQPKTTETVKTTTTRRTLRIQGNDQLAQTLIPAMRLRIRGDVTPAVPPQPTPSSSKKMGRPRTNHGPWPCSECNLVATQYEQYLNHLAERHQMGPRYGPFSCPICDAEFCSQRQLTDHMKRHKNPLEKVMHACGDCGKESARKVDVESHQKRMGCNKKKGVIRIEPRVAPGKEWNEKQAGIYLQDDEAENNSDSDDE